MAKKVVWLPKFDPDAAFVFRRRIKFAGKMHEANEPVNKDEINKRRLRQLYEMRAITLDVGVPSGWGAETPVETPPTPAAPTIAATPAAPTGTPSPLRDATTPQYGLEIKKGGWFKVLKDDVSLTDKSLREDEARELLMAELPADSEDLKELLAQISDD